MIINRKSGEPLRGVYKLGLQPLYTEDENHNFCTVNECSPPNGHKFGSIQITPTQPPRNGHGTVDGWGSPEGSPRRDRGGEGFAR